MQFHLLAIPGHISERYHADSSREPDQASTLFLDRDGVINVDHGYVHRCDQFDFVPGIFELARFWTDELRWPIVVVSNQ
jgi:histidinol phosphatase-like enzyme